MPKEEWMLGSKICKKFDELCSGGLILDTHGLHCKGFAYDYLFNELISYNQGQVIECFSSFPKVRSNISPAYKTLKFRIHPEYYDFIKKSI